MTRALMTDPAYEPDFCHGCGGPAPCEECGEWCYECDEAARWCACTRADARYHAARDDALGDRLDAEDRLGDLEKRAALFDYSVDEEVIR